MKKSKRKFNFVPLVVIMVLFAAVLVVSQSFSIDETVRSGDFISVPSFGALRCEQSNNKIITDFSTFGSKYIRCQDSGDTLIQDCTVNLRTPGNDAVSGLEEAVLLYSICTDGQPCDVFQGDTFQEKIIIRNAFITKQQNTNIEIPIPLNKNQFIYSEYKEKSGIFSSSKVVDGKASYNLAFFPFFIYKYDVFSSQNTGIVSGTRDCDWGAVDEPRANFIIEDIRGGGSLSANLEESKILDVNNLRSPDAYATYISNFVAVPPQFSLFDDGSKYCKDKKIYQVEEIETPSGVYKVADTSTNKEIETVDCCDNGDVPEGFYCDDFKQVKLSDSQGISCDAFNPCPIVGYNPLPGKQMVFQECVNNVCDTGYVDVACSFNEDCGSDAYCDVDRNNPNNNKCVEISIQESECGNNICEYSFGETPLTCPSDCQSVVKKDNTLLYVIIGAFVLIIVALILRSGGKR